jgi:hypothetical protein
MKILKPCTRTPANYCDQTIERKRGDIKLTYHLNRVQRKEFYLHARITRYTPSFIREIEAINRLLNLFC